ncbi:MAG: class I SAM-dependent methyltransferase [Rubrobacteraceae bacterium]
MPTEHEGDAIYAPGYSEEERQRLIEQAGFFGGFTERLLVDAGIGPGMRVLDVGCGVGDVSLLVASLVRPEGAVLGVDSNPLALGHARERVSAMGLTNVDFVEGNIRDLAFDEPFDAAVGRLVLMYLADPAATLRRIAALLRPGGIIAFQELTLTESGLTYPEAPLLQRTGTLINETFRRAGMEMEMGLKLYPAFIAAGLPAPAMRAERPIGGGPDFPGYRWMAQITRSILPLMEQLGVANAENIDVETLVERLREEVVGSGGVVAMPTLMGAWARKPTE